MRKNNSFGDILGAIAEGFGEIFKGFLRLFLKILVTFGLWLPILYALFGVVLFFGVHFNPFKFDVYGIIYLSGGVACIVCALIITVRNILIMPVKSAFNRSRKKHIEELDDAEFAEGDQERRFRQEAEQRRLSPPSSYPYFDEKTPEKGKEKRDYAPEYLPETEDFGDEDDDYARELLLDWQPRKKTPNEKPETVSVPKKEKPEIYVSKLNPHLLVYEYADRFELYKMVGKDTEYVGVEYK